MTFRPVSWVHLPQLVQLFHNTGIPTIAKPHEMFIPSIQIAQAHEIKYQMYCNCIKKHPCKKIGKPKNQDVDPSCKIIGLGEIIGSNMQKTWNIQLCVVKYDRGLLEHNTWCGWGNFV